MKLKPRLSFRRRDSSFNRKAANRRFANLADNLRAFSLSRELLVLMENLLLQLCAGSHALKNREKICFKHRKWLREKRRKIRGSQSAWQPKKKLSELPPYSRAQAYARRIVIHAYRDVLRDGLNPAYGERIARAVSVLILDKPYSAKHLQRIIAQVEQRGGIARCPIVGFATEKAIPHPGYPRSKKANGSR